MSANELGGLMLGGWTGVNLKDEEVRVKTDWRRVKKSPAGCK